VENKTVEMVVKDLLSVDNQKKKKKKKLQGSYVGAVTQMSCVCVCVYRAAMWRR